MNKSVTNRNLSSLRNDIFYMTGRFQPFTLGHLALLNNMILESRLKMNMVKHIYLFLIKEGDERKVSELLELLEQCPTEMNKVKALMKKDKSIMDNPLSSGGMLKLF